MNTKNKKSKIILAGLLAIIMAISMVPTAAFAETSHTWEGDGSETTPYIIKTYSDLQDLDTAVEGGETFEGKYFELANDITLGTDWNGIGTSTVEMKDSWGTIVPTTMDIKPFAGKFNGKGYTLTFVQNSKALFDCVRTATITDFKIKGEYIDGSGLVTNYIQDGGNATANISKVIILSGTKIGGSGFLGGYASSLNTVNIDSCVIEAGVTIGCDADGNSLDLDHIGGFAGEFNGSITNSTSVATVYGKDYVGGIVANMGQSGKCLTVENCTFAGKAAASGKFVGGIAGGGYAGSYWGLAANSALPLIKNCQVTGNVEGADCVGGILGGDEGVLQLWNNSTAEFKNNVFNGTIKSDGKNVGGVIGFLKSINKYFDMSDNTFKGTDTLTKGIGGIEFVDTSAATTAGGATYINTSGMTTSELRKLNEDFGLIDAWGSLGISKKDHNRTDDPLGVEAEKLAKNTAVKVDEEDNIKDNVAENNPNLNVNTNTATAPTDVDTPNSAVPKTGDMNNFVLWIALALAMGGMTMVCCRKLGR